VTLLEGDVREVKHEAVDVTVGFNFSYFIFQERADLLAYFRRAYESLARAACSWSTSTAAPTRSAR
jgi:hypothetical protein